MSDLPAVRPATVLLRRRIIATLAGGNSPRECAAALGVSPRTVYRALRDPEVRAELDRHHAERMQALLDASMELAPDALATLRAMMDSPIVPPSTKVAAARAAVATIAAVVPLADTERRIAALEEQMHLEKGE